jgi:hypothetical protein
MCLPNIDVKLTQPHQEIPQSSEKTTVIPSTSSSSIEKTSGQIPSADYVSVKHRDISIPIKYENARRKMLKSVQFFVSRDQGQTWTKEDEVTPDHDSISFFAEGRWSLLVQRGGSRYSRA